MSKENRAELFIRLLVEALETDRVIRKHGFSIRSKTYANRYRQLFSSDRKYAPGSFEPQDCVQAMSDTPQQRRLG